MSVHALRFDPLALDSGNKSRNDRLGSVQRIAHIATQEA